jgi:hypothetical protein
MYYNTGKLSYKIIKYNTNGCVNSCVNSPEDGPVGPKHVEIRRYMNKIEIVTSVGFSFHMLMHVFYPKCVKYKPVKFSLPEYRTQNLRHPLYVLRCSHISLLSGIPAYDTV